MREVLFTGKRVDNGEWAFGNFIEDKWGDDNGNTVYAILQDRVAPEIAALWTPVKVIPETVGEYTGLKDKNGKKIFEGYVVTYIGEVCVVEWDDETAKFVLKNENLLCDFEEVWCNRFKSKIEVIGNVHDNPELLEVSDK